MGFAAALSRPGAWCARALAALLLGAALAGCGSSATSGPDGVADVAGRYVLTRVNGETLPTATAIFGDYRVTEGDLELRRDGSVHRRVRYESPTEDYPLLRLHDGTYRRESATVVRLELVDPVAALTYVWSTSAELLPNAVGRPDVVMRYPRAGGGADVVEVFEPVSASASR